MSKSIVYPTGVENHGGFLRIWFIYQGKRYREATGLPDTPKNRKQAREIRQSVQYEIRSGIFDYYHRFPESKNAGNFSTKTVKQITVKDMFSKWLELKKPEISLNTYNRYICKLDTCAMILGEKKHIDAITQENLLFLRNELLTGNHRPARQRKVIKKGRTVATVNDYIVCIKGVLRFAYENGYIDKDPTTSIKKLKKSRTPPDPFNQDEFGRFIEACTNLQSKNLWTVAFYTGIRPGELSALAWEDVDLDAGTITVRRNWTAAKQYTLPKTNAGTDRVIVLLEPAINALKAQMPLTYMRESVKVDVRLREFGKIRKDKCTFIFDPSINARGYAIKSGRYSTTTLGDMWDRTIKKAKIRHRNAYQTRHTYACWMLSAGANPSFLATQMGHSSAQMIFTVYGDWMPENNNDQVEMLNSKLSNNAPSMPHKLKVV